MQSPYQGCPEAGSQDRSPPTSTWRPSPAGGGVPSVSEASAVPSSRFSGFNG